MKPTEITAVYALSKFFVPYFRKSIETLPSEMPIIVSYYGEGDAPDDLPPNVQVCRPKRTVGNFMRGYAINVAVRRCTTPWVLIADADMVFPKTFLDNLNAEWDPRDVRRFFIGRLTLGFTDEIMSRTAVWERCRPYQAKYSWQPGITGRVINKMLSVLRLDAQIVFRKTLVDFKEIYGSNNPCVYSREFLYELRGYDERFVGWGGEDDDLTRRTLKAGGTETRIPVIVGHLEHPLPPDYKGYRTQSNRHQLQLSGDPRSNLRAWGDKGT